MNNKIYRFFAAVAVLCALFAAVACVSGNQEVGLVDERLRPCPDTPNCVSSEDQGKPSFIEPLAFQGTPETAWEQVKKVIAELGGKIEKEEDGYLWATFTSKIFRFVDDLELRMDKDKSSIQIRSASRVGYSDLGVNTKRVETLRAEFNQAESS